MVEEKTERELLHELGNALQEKRELLDHCLQCRASLRPSNEYAFPGSGAEQR